MPRYSLSMTRVRLTIELNMTIQIPAYIHGKGKESELMQRYATVPPSVGECKIMERFVVNRRSE
jgi:hypothetical protein